MSEKQNKQPEAWYFARYYSNEDEI